MNGMPTNWAEVALDEVGQWGSGGTPLRSNAAYYNGGTIPWLVIGDLNDSIVTTSSGFITQSGLENSSAKLLPVDTLLVAMYGSIGKLGITGFECATNQAIAFCRPNRNLVELPYLFYALMNAKPSLVSLGQGGAQQNISQGILRGFKIHLAPLAEQKRIAEKLDDLLARVDASRDRLDRIPAILKRFRQAVLVAATSGELTRDWREKRETSLGGWVETTIGALLDGKPRNGYSPPAVETPTPVKSLTLTATTSGRFRGEHFKYIGEPIPNDSYLWLEPGDVLVQRANTLEYVGVSAIYDGPRRSYIYPDLMMKCRANEQVVPKFLWCLLSGESVRRYFRENATGTAGNMPKINQQTVMSAPVRLPPHDEQQEVVRIAEKLLASCDALEDQYHSAVGYVSGLTASILAKAFRGELAPQDISDEPVSVLLERIQAELATFGPPPKKRERQRRIATEV